METIELWTDGCCLKNPGGAGGAASVILYPDGTTTTVCSFNPETTNNIMELQAIKQGLQLLFCRAHFNTKIKIYSDSQYSIKVCDGSYKAKKNLLLVNEIKSMLTRLSNVEFIWVKGHSGIEMNEYADQLALFAARKGLPGPLPPVKKKKA